MHTWKHIDFHITYTAQCVHVTFYVAIIIQDSWACGTWRHVASCLCSPWMHMSAVWGCSVDVRSGSCSALATAPPSSASGPHPGVSAQQLKPPETETCLESPAAVKKRRTLRENSAISILLAMWWTDIRECGVRYMTEANEVFTITQGQRRKMLRFIEVKIYSMLCWYDGVIVYSMYFYLHYTPPIILQGMLSVIICYLCS